MDLMYILPIDRVGLSHTLHFDMYFSRFGPEIGSIVIGMGSLVLNLYLMKL